MIANSMNLGIGFIPAFCDGGEPVHSCRMRFRSLAVRNKVHRQLCLCQCCTHLTQSKSCKLIGLQFDFRTAVDAKRGVSIQMMSNFMCEHENSGPLIPRCIIDLSYKLWVV